MTLVCRYNNNKGLTERAQILYKTYNPFSRPNGQLVCTKTNEEFNYYDDDCVEDNAVKLAVSI